MTPACSMACKVALTELKLPVIDEPLSDWPVTENGLVLLKLTTAVP